MHRLKRYSIIDLAESLKRGGDIRRGKYERGLSGMQLEVLPKAHGRFGAALPTMQLYRDLEIGLVDGGQNLAVTSVLPVAQAARPETVFETAGAQVVQLNDTSGATLPVFDGEVTDTTWISENAPAPSFSALTVKSVQSTPKCCSSRIAYSRRLAALASDKAAFEQSLLTELRRAIKVEIEKKYFSGSGSSDQPLGIYNTSGIGSKTFSAALPSHSELVDMIELLADNDGDLTAARFLVHPSDMTGLLKQQVTSGGGDTTLSYVGNGYRIAGVPVFATTAATEGKILLADMTAITLLFYGPPQLIVDAFSGGKSTTGQTELIVQNYVDSLIRDRNLVVVGSA